MSRLRDIWDGECGPADFLLGVRFMVINFRPVHCTVYGTVCFVLYVP